MKKITLGIIIVFLMVLVAIVVFGVYKFNFTNDDIHAACTEEAKICPDGSAVGRTGPKCEFVPCPIENDQTVGAFSETEARAIAENICIKGGEALLAGRYNENSKTWWFDANLNATRQGCNPACVVSEETKTAEINWRCTGLIVPHEADADIIRQLFAQKYPKYATTVSVNILQETEGHKRGQVSFVVGEPGGIFLVAEIDGQWQIVFDGNGAIPCDLAQYGFPSEMLSDCAEY
jgi:hypothetical protein